MYFPVLLCLSVSVKWLAVKTSSEMTKIVSGGALNSTNSTPVSIHGICGDLCIEFPDLALCLDCFVAKRRKIPSICIYH